MNDIISVIVEGGGGEQTDTAGDTVEDAVEARAFGQHLPGLPPLVGQDGRPLIVPIQKAKTAGLTGTR